MAHSAPSVESILAEQVTDLEQNIRIILDRKPGESSQARPLGLPALSADPESAQRLADRLEVVRFATRALLEGERTGEFPESLRDSMQRLGPDDLYLKFSEQVLARICGA